jgi:serine/threonine-protein kinase
MDLADQGSLNQRLRPKNGDLGLTIGMRYEIALGIISGLQYLHENHVVHRDLKPANILLFGSELIPKIADFGLATVIERSTTAIRSDVGTPLYQAPETFDTEQQGYQSSADIYSVSLILYELLSGQKPIACRPGGNVGQIINIKRKKHPPAQSLDIPDRLFSLICKGYRLDPKKRPKLPQLHSSVELHLCKSFRYSYRNPGLMALGVQFRTGLIFIMLDFIVVLSYSYVIVFDFSLCT